AMRSESVNNCATTPIEVQVVRNPAEQAYETAQEIRDKVIDLPGAADVRIFQRFDYPQMFVEVDRQKAQLLGLDVGDVYQTVATALTSSVSVDWNFWLDPKNGNQY